MAGLKVTCPEASASATCTSPVGFDFNTTVYVAVVPAPLSFTLNAVAGVRVRPIESISVIVAVTLPVALTTSAASLNITAGDV